MLPCKHSPITAFQKQLGKSSPLCQMTHPYGVSVVGLYERGLMNDAPE